VGVKLGFMIGVFLGVLAVVGWLIGGPDVFDSLRASLLQVVVLNVVIASMLGGVVGLLGRIVQTRLGAFVAGCVLALPVALLMGLARGEGLPMELVDWFVPVVFSVALGGSLGLMFRELFHK